MFHAPHGNQRAPLPPVRESGAPATNRTAGTEERPARPAGAGGGREAYFDNAKYLAIVLVAVAHAWEPVMEGSRAARALYMFVYAFHMPAFILISGYFSRSFTGRPHQIQRLVTGIVVPYVVFEVAYTLFRRWAADEPTLPVSLTNPFYLTWFLIALFVWRLTTPLWNSLRHPLPVALVIACLGSLTPGISDDLDLQRIFQFLPFFVLGLCLRPEHFRWVRRRAVRLAALPLVAGALVFAYWVAPRLRMSWFYRSTSAPELGSPWWAGPLMTLSLFACALLLTAAFLAWVPVRRTWFTVLGAGTICGYLLHGFLVKSLDYWRVVRLHPWLTEPGGLVLTTLTAATAVTLLCTPPVRRALRCVTEPRMDWAFRKQ
ncbi:acyltransferase family protein [Streptomyces sp. NPDC006368]|uniref:acyltransferase family protein n=1 Tax=Streptomyces sp. NPDC006368 TaxID=3156760 RepID=UPI0033A5137C